MPTLSGHVDEETAKKAKARAVKNNKGNMSGYIGDLIRSDVSDTNKSLEDLDSANCLVELCEIHCPDFTSYMKGFCKEHNLSQPLALSALLRLFALGQSGISSSELAKHYSIPMAAEDQAKYGK
ncbi:hypothetical protein MLD52_21710 [Puniceicoccaceae bacterium K14]|nr:hypothetical protein [Puniceicoccaceae bacterium K14]